MNNSYDIKLYKIKSLKIDVKKMKTIEKIHHDSHSQQVAMLVTQTINLIIYQYSSQHTCNKALIGAIPVPGPIMRIGVAMVLGRRKLDGRTNIWVPVPTDNDCDL